MADQEQGSNQDRDQKREPKPPKAGLEQPQPHGRRVGPLEPKGPAARTPSSTSGTKTGTAGSST